MITGDDWYDYQLEQKRKQLSRHKKYLEIYAGKDVGVDLEQMVYDDEQYIYMLKLAKKTAKGYDSEFGWCADK